MRSTGPVSAGDRALAWPTLLSASRVPAAMTDRTPPAETGHGTPVRVDHVGIAVASIPDAERALFALGAEKTHEEPSHDGAFVWATYDLGDASRVELLAPTGDGESFLTAFLNREGPGLHHLTLEVADLGAVVAACEGAGLPVVDRTDRGDWTEAFVSPRNPTGALVQLMEYREGYAADRPGAYVGGERLTDDREDRVRGRDGTESGSDVTETVATGDVATANVPEAVAERVAADPYCRLLGVELRALGEGTATTALPVSEELLNFHGTPHGGAVYSLADAAFAAASNSRRETALALETNVSYLDAADVGDTLVAKATETHRSRRTAEYEVVVRAEGEGGEGGGEPPIGDRVATFRGRVYLP